MTEEFSIIKDGNIYYLKGILDEKVNFDLLIEAPEDPLTIDFQSVTRLNSFGLKQFIQMRRQCEKDRRIIFRNCPSFIVDQMNIVSEFRGNAEIESFSIPFFCVNCKDEQNVQIKSTQVQTPNFRTSINQLFKCEKCQTHLEFCDDVSTYFDFLFKKQDSNSLKPKTIPDKAKFSINLKDGIYYLDGILNEQSDLGSLADSNDDPLIFDFSNLQRMNSYGIKKWIVSVKGLSGKKITYQNCPSFFIDQLNIVHELRAGAEIKSFALPLYCATCKAEKPAMIEVEKAKDPEFQEKIDALYKCPLCDDKLEFDDDVDSFFDFLK